MKNEKSKIISDYLQLNHRFIEVYKLLEDCRLKTTFNVRV
jgi:hypothetical protein